MERPCSRVAPSSPRVARLWHAASPPAAGAKIHPRGDAPRRDPVIATAGARWVETSVEERPTTQTTWVAVWGGDRDALEAGSREDLIEGEVEHG